MKKLTLFLLALALCLCTTLTAFASGEAEDGDQDEAETYVTQQETTEDASQPRLMVTSYKLSTETITPGESSDLEITMKNYSSAKAVKNIKLSLLDESGEVKASGMSTAYVDSISAGGTYVWKIALSAVNNAKTGEHIMTFTAEYEDKYYAAYSASDSISVTVSQVSDLGYSGIELPVKATQGDTETVTVSLMNTGKTTLSNCKVDFNVDGFESAGTLYIGEIAPNESKDGSINLRVSSDKTGDVSGKATVSYEDELGEAYTKEVELTSLIEEKVEYTETTEEEDEESKYPMWWLFLIVGAVVGGSAGAGIPAAIRARKQRREDELRL